jgi:hypothetical protein
MRGIAWLLLALGPLASAPAAAGLFALSLLARAHGADFYALAVAGAVLVAEALLLSFRGLVREVTVFALSALWGLWLWLGLSQPGYGWVTLPLLRTPDGRGWMAVIAAMLVWMALYGFADGRPARGERLS